MQFKKNAMDHHAEQQNLDTYLFVFKDGIVLILSVKMDAENSINMLYVVDQYCKLVW